MATASETAPMQLDTELFQRLVEAAGKAPSPDNNQPWMFRRGDDGIGVLHRRDRALPSDAKDLFSWTAIGSAIENLVLAASAEGLAARIEYHARPFATSAEGEHVATVRLSGGGEPDPLHEFIAARTTNRRLYRRELLGDAERAVLSAAVADPNSTVSWLTGRSEIKPLSKLVLRTDRIRFEYEPFHDEFHKVLRYGDDEARRTGDGLDLRTLEIARPAWPVMRWLQPWPRMRVANRLGMSRAFAGYSAKQVVRSGALGLLTTRDDSDRGRLEAGRSLQRLWLAATRDGWAFQPLGGIPLFLTKLREAGRDAFLPEHAARLEDVAAAFCELYPAAREETPVMLFRIGYAKPPSARSYRYGLKKITATET